MDPRRFIQIGFALAGAIAEFKLYPVVHGILVKDFFKLSLNERKFLTGATLIPYGQLENTGNPDRPYFAPFQQVVKRVLSYAPVGGKAHFFFGVDRIYAAYAKVLNRQRT
jgi:hypothetical protein